jgi:hypothetical protein
MKSKSFRLLKKTKDKFYYVFYIIFYEKVKKFLEKKLTNANRNE